ncbi:hypothetical protein AB0M87_21835 [Streptomyces sp. NPDC051320]|uniref:hypothetical protein n=1 Tax=Streptomyces sp. NPDC051320 TaxID=3154644 RepID=UPI003440E09D
MEQQIGPKSPPVHGAATDPAFVPGLMPARPAAAVDEAPSPVDDKAAEEVTDQVPAAPAPEPEADAPQVTTPDATDAEPAPSLSDDGAGESEAGPEFEAADRRGAIVANRAGLVFRLDDQEAEFGWDEIGAVEFDTSKYGRRLSVIVHLLNRHRYETDITARSKDLLAEWTTQLDEVLDAYFEE